MSLLQNFNLNENFWDTEPEFALAGPTKVLYTSDKSRNKVVSSKLMWTIVMIWDRGSKYYNQPEDGPEGKVALLFEDYYGDLSYYEKNKEKIHTLRDYYRKLQETPAQRTLRGIEKKLEERDEFLKNTEYSLGERSERGFIFGTVDILDKMMANNKKLYDQYDEARKTVLQELEKDTAKGGASQSLSDQGEM